MPGSPREGSCPARKFLPPLVRMIVRMIVAPVPILLLFGGLRFVERTNLNVILIEIHTVALGFVIVPLVVVFVRLVVIASIVVVVGHGQRSGQADCQ
jgi:hypothetical protein